MGEAGESSPGWWKEVRWLGVLGVLSSGSGSEQGTVNPGAVTIVSLVRRGVMEVGSEKDLLCKHLIIGMMVCCKCKVRGSHHMIGF